MKQASVLFATALAHSVLPVPGGPNSRTPFGGSMPRFTNFSGYNVQNKPKNSLNSDQLVIFHFSIKGLFTVFPQNHVSKISLRLQHHHQIISKTKTKQTTGLIEKILILKQFFQVLTSNWKSNSHACLAPSQHCHMSGWETYK
jgi:hypothetical protein